ncbi:MAG: glycosyltransferase family 39 protein [Phycisphaerae bacterium]
MLLAVVHLWSLFNPFFIDDYIYLDTVHDLGWSGVPAVLASPTMDQDASGVWWTPYGDLPFYRPLGVLTFAVDYWLWGMNPFGYHLTNLLLHLACTFLVWRLGLRLMGDARSSFAAAVIFGLHPAHCEAVLWISGRFDLLVCVCALASVLSYLRWRCGEGGRWRWWWLSVFWFAAGLGCKETAIVLPGVLVLAECLRLCGGGGPRVATRGLAGAIGFGVVAALYLAKRFALFGGMGSLPPPYGVDLLSPGAAGQVLWNLAQYMLDFVFFIQVDAIYLSVFWAAHAWLLMLGAAAAVGVLVLFGRVAGETRGFRMGMVFAILFTAPALVAMPGERNVYLACVGVALVGASVYGKLWGPTGCNPWACGFDMRRWSKVAVSAWVLMIVLEHGVMWRVAAGAEQVYQDLLTQVPDPPENARIFVVNQCPLNAVGFTQGVKLRYGRDDVVACALALAPQLEGFSTDRVYRTGRRSLKIVRQNGVFFDSFIERFLMFSEPVTELAESARRLDLELLEQPESLAGLTELHLGLPGDLDDAGIYLFTWDNRHVRSLVDLLWRADWPRLVPCEYQTVVAAVLQD